MNERYVDTLQSDNWLSFSPMAWLAEQAFGFATHLLNGVQVNFPEGPETVPTDMREIAPAGSAFPQSCLGKSGAQWCNFASTTAAVINRALYRAFHARRLPRHRPGRRAPPDSSALCASSVGWANTPFLSPCATNWG